MIIAIWCRHFYTNIIAVNGSIPWYSKQDKKFFRKISQLGCVVMGKKTYNDINAHNPSFLKNQSHIVLSKKDNIDTVIDSEKYLIIAGGSNIYYNFLKHTNVNIVYDCVFEGEMMNVENAHNIVRITDSVNLLHKKYQKIKSFRIDKNVICNKWVLTTKFQ